MINGKQFIKNKWEFDTLKNDNDLKFSYFFQGGRLKRLENSEEYAKEMFYGYHYFLNKYKNVELKEFTTEQSALRKLFFKYIEKNLRAALKLPLYWSFVVNSSNYQTLKSSNFSIFSSNRIGCSVLPMVIYLKLRKSKITTLSFVLGLLSRTPKYKFFTPFQNIYIRIFFMYTDKLIFLSQGEFEFAKQKHSKFIDKFYYLPFAVDLDVWTLKNQTTEKRNILFVGNDGFRDFKIAEDLSKKLKEFNFTYVSQNIDKDNLNPKNSVLKNGSWGNPFLTDTELKKEYHNAFITIIPLKESLQPSGQSVALQSLACGTPVIITKTKGFWDFNNFQDKKNINFINNSSIDEWENKILELWNLNNDGYEKLVKNGRDLIDLKYSLKKFSEEVENILIS